MPLDDDTIKLRIARRGYPSSLTEEMVDEAIQRAREDIANIVPIHKMGNFNTVVGQNVYNIFSRQSPSPTELVDATGLRVWEVMWQPSDSDWTTNDVFGIAPLLQGLIIPGVFTPIDLGFTTPSDYSIFAENLNTWRQRFNEGGGQQITSEQGSALMLFPNPQIVTSVFVFYSTANTNGDLEVLNESAFLLLVEANLCTPMSIRSIELAGIQIGAFKDTGKSVTSWDTKEKNLREKATALMEQNNSNVNVPGTRS